MAVPGDLRSVSLGAYDSWAFQQNARVSTKENAQLPAYFTKPPIIIGATEGNLNLCQDTVCLQTNRNTIHHGGFSRYGKAARRLDGSVDQSVLALEIDTMCEGLLHAEGLTFLGLGRQRV